MNLLNEKVNKELIIDHSNKSKQLNLVTNELWLK
jgi:hypothetical protein